MTASITILLLALAQVETADANHPQGNDLHHGKSGEVSRYSIMPRVFKRYRGFGEADPTNPEHAATAAMNVIMYRNGVFKKATGHPPSYADIYGMWNKPDLMRKAHYRVDRLPPRVRARCLRFQNLVLDLERNK